MTMANIMRTSPEQLCRTCLAKDADLLPVFDECLGSVSLDFIVGFITGIKIEPGDGLPTSICYECKEKAIKAFEFKKRSLVADSKLRGQLKKEKNDFEIAEVPVFQSKTIMEVKTEQILMEQEADDKDVFDCDFPLDNDDYEVTDTVKKETLTEEYLHSENKSEEKKKKSIKVEPEDSLSTYCPMCGTSYDGAENLTKHMWRYHADLMGPKKRGRPKKLVTSSILTKLTENGFLLKKNLICILCKEQCKTKEDLGIHMMKHQDCKVICCFVCKKMFLRKKHFEQHKCGTKIDNTGEAADEATQRESNYIVLRDILDPHCDMDNLNVLRMCKDCNGVFVSEEDLLNHTDTDHPDRSLRCNNCPKEFTTLKAASRHRFECQKIDRKHVCNSCGLRFAYEISLNKHILRHHEGQSVSVTFSDPIPVVPQAKQPQYQCDTCQRCFPKKESLAKHTKAHMPVEKCFECEVCKKRFSRKDNLRSHKKIHEPNREKPPNNCLCLYCGRGFSNSSNLIVHMRRHTGEKPYKCDFCEKGFPRSSDLQCHRRSHTGEKPCVCRICGKGFSRSNKLSRHMRVHTGLKPYKCTYCDKAFSQSNDLTLHIRRHTGDKPYICEICGDRFIQGTALQTHRRIHGHYASPSSSAAAAPPAFTYSVQNITQ